MTTKPNMELATALVSTLPTNHPGLFNPWHDRCEGDTALNSAEARILRLAQHLACKPKVLVLGEASGYQGMRRSGMAFTSEFQLLNGKVPRVPAPAGRLTERDNPYVEPSATIVWRTLRELGLQDEAVLWNALPMHPFKPVAHKSGEVLTRHQEVTQFDTNRTPTKDELVLGGDAMRILVQAFPRAKVVAVGRSCEKLLALLGIQCAAQIRHPAYGGATDFARGLAAVAGTIK